MEKWRRFLNCYLFAHELYRKNKDTIVKIVSASVILYCCNSGKFEKWKRRLRFFGFLTDFSGKNLHFRQPLKKEQYNID